MDFARIFLILRARYKIALAMAVVAFAAALTVNELLPRRYVAQTVVMVDVRSPDPIAALMMPASMNSGNLGTQVDLIRSDRVGRKVVRMLRLDADPGLREAWRDATGGKGKFEDWMSSLLQKGVLVNPSRESSMIYIEYQSRDPVFAAAAANAFAQAYIETSVELKVEPARQYSEWFAEQAKTLRENVEKAQSRLSAFQREKGVTEASAESEAERLRELTARLGAVQSAVRDAGSRERLSGADVPPDVSQNTMIQSLRTSIAQLEVKIKESATNLGARHPQYLRMQIELGELKARLAAEMKQAASAASSIAIGRSMEADLRAAINAQTRRVLAMQKDRDEIAVLARDVEAAKRAYEAVTTRLTQSTLESQATRTNIFVLTPAVEPIDASFPMPLRKILLIALGAALLLAAASIAGLEFLDRRVRTADDLATMLQMPVLAVVESCRPPRAFALGFGRRAPALSKQA